MERHGTAPAVAERPDHCFLNLAVAAVVAMMVSVSLNEVSSPGAGARANQRSFAATDQRASNQTGRTSDQCSLFHTVLFMTAVIMPMLSTHAHAAERSHHHHQHKK